MDDSVYRPRPELGHFPDNPRVPIGEAGFIYEIRIALQPGAQNDAAEVLGKLSALRKRHNIQDVTIVWFKVMGNDAPGLSVFFPARDAVDFHTQSDKNTEMMGAEFTTLVRQIQALSRKTESVHWTIRRDLSYAPTN